MRHTLPSTRPGPHLCAGSSSPETRCVPARPGDRSGLWPGRRRPRSRRTLSASGRTPSAASQARHRAWKLAPAPANAASRWRLSLPRCSAFVFSSRALSVILTEERVLHFQPRRHKFVSSAGAEVIETNQNFNYSRSLIYVWAEPYSHTGFRLQYPVGAHFTGSFQVVNGWNNVEPINGNIDVFGVRSGVHGDLINSDFTAYAAAQDLVDRARLPMQRKRRIGLI